MVILIDEYDNPILDNITGVSKFSKMNLFSGLNNLVDITIDARYADICGYTHHDIKTTFIEYLQNVDLEKLREWYK